MQAVAALPRSQRGTGALEVVRNLARRKLRTALTVSGIVIGVLALTTMGAMAERANSGLQGAEAFLSDHISVEDSGNQYGFNLVRTTTVKAIERVHGVAAAFPTVGLPAEWAQGGAFAAADSIVARPAAEARYLHFKLMVTQGRDLNPRHRGEVVLGAGFARELGARPGQTITLPVPPSQKVSGYRGHHFRVVGILGRTLAAPDNWAEVNLADGQMLLGESLPPAIRRSLKSSTTASGIDVFGRTGVNLDTLAATIGKKVPDVRATAPSVLVKQFQQAGVVFAVITMGSAVLALIVGGLSVINTMLMAVSERAREIGLKRAVGARTTHILREFLFEAFLIGMLGGAIGLFLGWLVTTLINTLTEPQNLSLFLVTPRLAALAIVFSMGLGSLAGLVPAWRAARLDPVRALRSS